MEGRSEVAGVGPESASVADFCYLERELGEVVRRLRAIMASTKGRVEEEPVEALLAGFSELIRRHVWAMVMWG